MDARHACFSRSLAVSAVVAALLIGTAASGADRAVQENQPPDELRERYDVLLKGVVARYQALSTYADTAIMMFEVELEEGSDPFGAEMPAQEMRIAIEQPNKVAIASEHIIFHSNGESVWTYLPMFSQYTRHDAGRSLGDVLLAEEEMVMHVVGGHPVLSILLRDDGRFDEHHSEMAEILSMEEMERDGKRGTLIRATAVVPQYEMMYEDPIPFETWIDAETGLITEVAWDMTDLYNSFAEGMGEVGADVEDGEDEELFGGMEFPRYKKFRMVMSLHDVKMNQPIAAERFVFEPGEDAEEVEFFDFSSMSESNQMALLGVEAPDFTLPTLDGGEQTLSDLRGKVVLLDFWALWCGPCVQAMPHMQKIASHFEGEDVVVLGVNGDSAGSEDRIKKLLEGKEVQFPQVLDVEGEVSGLYHVSGIPCTILIDQEGIVQDIGIGFHPSKVEDMTAKIEKLLAGEKLHTPEEFEELRAGAVEEEAEPDRRRAQGDLDDVLNEALGQSPLQFERRSLPRSMRSNPWRVKLLDVDGDGREEAVVPHERLLYIVDLHGRSSKKLSLSNPPANSYIEDFCMVRVDGEMHWAISYGRHAMFGTRSGIVILFDSEGEQAWSFSPELPRSVQATYENLCTADLTGDGRPEIVLTLHAAQMGKGRRAMTTESQVTQVVVFDLKGDILARRTLGDFAYGLHVVDPLSDATHTRQTIFCVGDDRAYWLELDDAAGDLSLRD